MPDPEEPTNATATATQTEPEPRVEDRPAIATTEETASSELPSEEKGTTEPVTSEDDPLKDTSEEFQSGYRQAQGGKDREINDLKAGHETTLAEAREAADDASLKLKADHQDTLRQTQQNAIAHSRTELLGEGMEKFLDMIEEHDPGRSDEITKQLGRLLQENNGWAALTAKQRDAAARQQGEAQGVQRGSQLMQEHLPKEVADKLGPFIEKQALRVRAGDVTPTQQWKNVIEHMVELLDKRSENRLEKQIVERLGQEAKAKSREAEPQPAAISGRGGSGGGLDNSDQARLDRLAYGRDTNGQAPTEADREWLAARN